MSETALPPDDASVETWRSFAITHAADARLRRAILAAAERAGHETRREILTTLVVRARGQARVDVIERCAKIAASDPPRESLVYALVGELLASSGATRDACVHALGRASDDERHGIALALALTARAPGFRETNERTVAAWDAWHAAHSAVDPLSSLDAREWLHACRVDATKLPVHTDHALLLATAGGSRGTVAHLRALVQHLIATRGSCSPSAARLLAWLARQCTRADAAPASVRHPEWFALAVDALARTATHEAPPSAALSHAIDSFAGDALDRALAFEIVRRLVVDARRAHGEAASALGDGLASVLRAVCAQPDDIAREVHAMLLGRDRDGSLVGSGRWLSDDLRTLVLESALVHEALGARAIALGDIERNGLPAALMPLLRTVASSDTDPVVRQHARQLVRGERV